MRSLAGKGRSMTLTCLCLTHSLTHSHNPLHATIRTFSPPPPPPLHKYNPLFQVFSVSHSFSLIYCPKNQSMFFSEIFALLSKLFVLFQGILRPVIRSFSTKVTASGQSMGSFDSDSVTYLTQQEAAEIDETLMGPLGFSVDQLMVLNHHRILYFFIFLLLMLMLNNAFDFCSLCTCNCRNWLV